MADEYISRKAAMEYLYRAINADPDGNCPSCIHDEHDCQYDGCWALMDFCEKIEYLGYVPAADVVPVRHGRWEQKEVFEAKGCVDELQSAFCPVCQRYHTTPYAYYFTHYNYCPNCGAKMDGEA